MNYQPLSGDFAWENNLSCLLADYARFPEGPSFDPVSVPAGFQVNNTNSLFFIHILLFLFNSVHPLPAYLRETGSRPGFDHFYERGRDEHSRVSNVYFNINY